MAGPARSRDCVRWVTIMEGEAWKAWDLGIASVDSDRYLVRVMPVARMCYMSRWQPISCHAITDGLYFALVLEGGLLASRHWVSVPCC